MRRIPLTLVTIATICAAAGARAQAEVIYVPVYRQPAIFADADDRFANAYDIQGVVTSFFRFNMTVRVNGREIPVVLHQGTIIKPTGTTLTPSMIVNVAGYWQAGAFYANRIVVRRF